MRSRTRLQSRLTWSHSRHSVPGMRVCRHCTLGGRTGSMGTDEQTCNYELMIFHELEKDQWWLDVSFFSDLIDTFDNNVQLIHSTT